MHPLYHRVHLATLAAVASSEELRTNYVLKGGLALRLIYGSPRQSGDLDFNAVAHFDRSLSEANHNELIHFCHLLDDALQESAPAYGFSGMAVQHQLLSDSIPTVMAQIGYGIGDDDRRPYEQRVPMQVTLCEVVCETRTATVDGVRVHAASLEDILAEKLKAMAQQVDRGITRSTDVFDLWYYARQKEPVPDVQLMRRFLREKSAPAGVEPERIIVDVDLFRAFSGNDYAAIGEQLDSGVDLPPFDQAYEAVVELVRELTEVRA